MAALLHGDAFTAPEPWRQGPCCAHSGSALPVLGCPKHVDCGAWVLSAARTTTATNIALIYSVSPVLDCLVPVPYHERQPALRWAWPLRWPAVHATYGQGHQCLKPRIRVPGDRGSWPPPPPGPALVGLQRRWLRRWEHRRSPVRRAVEAFQPHRVEPPGASLAPSAGRPDRPDALPA